MFQYCTGLTSISLPSLKAISVSTACQRMFQYCTGLTGINLKIQAISNSNSASYMFASCSNISNLDFSSLITVSAYYGSDNMFNGCTGLVSANLSSFIMATGQSCCQAMFSGCSNLASVDISHLAKLSSGSLSQMFRNCTSLTSLSFDNLVYTTSNINSAFQNTLQGVTGCTVHFPSDWQTAMASYSNITNGLGGTNTTVLFDLPAVTTLDLTPIKETVVDGQFREFGSVNYPLPNITSVDLSGLTTITANNACQNMFNGCTGLTSVDLSNLTTISGNFVCQNMFNGCTGLTSFDLGSLKFVIGSSSCFNMFYNCTSLTSADLSSLEYVSNGDSSAFSNMFKGCSLLQTADFSSLIRMNGSCATYMFQDCTSLTNVKLDSLKQVSQQSCQYMCSGCIALSSVSFPALRTFNGSSWFNSMCDSIQGCVVHFPSNLSGTTGLNAATIGGTNTTVLFDLPATNILTGADTVEYERNPKYDTVTALAWRVKDGGTDDEPIIDWTPYYTSGLTDPTVGTTIYSDSACTIAETTVDSIS